MKPDFDDDGGDDTMFFAAVPTEQERAATMATVGRLTAEYGLRFRPRPPGVLHATMMKIGTFRAVQPRLSLIAQIAGLVRGRASDLVFDRMMMFGGGALVIACSDVPETWRELCRQLRTAPLKLGLSPIGGSSPHVTFGHEGTAPDVVVSPKLAWRVDSFVLLRSHLGKGRHTELGRWPLGN